jgi:hypothetical protein
VAQVAFAVWLCLDGPRVDHVLVGAEAFGKLNFGPLGNISLIVYVVYD